LAGGSRNWGTAGQLLWFIFRAASVGECSHVEVPPCGSRDGLVLSTSLYGCNYLQIADSKSLKQDAGNKFCKQKDG
jgi:hypothetical protein